MPKWVCFCTKTFVAGSFLHTFCNELAALIDTSKLIILHLGAFRMQHHQFSTAAKNHRKLISSFFLQFVKEQAYLLVLAAKNWPCCFRFVFSIIYDLHLAVFTIFYCIWQQQQLSSSVQTWFEIHIQFYNLMHLFNLQNQRDAQNKTWAWILIEMTHWE